MMDPEPDLVILDVMMPVMSGLRTCEEIRKISYVPILFLTAKAQESDKLIGLMAGGDDYLGKPFSYAELLGRVKALLRRYKVYRGSPGDSEEKESDYLELGGIRIHKQYNEVFVRGRETELSDIEYRMLLLMMEHPRKIFSAQNLYESVWNEPYFYNCNATVTVHIRKLRVKVEEDPRLPRLINTVWERGIDSMREVNRRNSLYFLLVKLLTVSMAAAVVFYALLSLVSDYAVSRYYNGSAYVDRRDSQYLESLQEYVKENQVKTTDTAKISRWVSRQKVVFIQIYRDNVLMYDSNHSDLEDLWEEQVEQVYYDWESYYQVTFADGEAEVVIYGTYEYQLYNYAMIFDLLLAFLLFMTLVILGIRRKMAYIRLLSQEIEILEGGNLEYPITVRGKDELAQLAWGLDCMRQSFREQVEQEARLTQENQRIITEMSHDLRTPLTSIMLYTEILKKGPWKKDPKLLEYVEKIDGKARRMKQMSDHLFEYSLVSENSGVELRNRNCLKCCFMTCFPKPAVIWNSMDSSEVSGCLDSQEYPGKYRIHCPYHGQSYIQHCQIRQRQGACGDRISGRQGNGRIFYREYSEGHGRKAGEHRDRNPEYSEHDEKMGGKCGVSCTENRFRIEIEFPCAGEK